MIELNTENHVKYNIWGNVLKDFSYNFSDNVYNSVWRNVCNNVLKNVKFNILKDSQNHTKLK
jgi:hypothetical protein